MEFMFTKEDKRTVEELSQTEGRTLVSYTRLPNEDAFIVISAHEDWIPRSFTIPGALYPDREAVISTDDPGNTGRPARCMLYIDKEFPMIAWECGAYWVPIGTKFLGPITKITRTDLLKRSKIK